MTPDTARDPSTNTDADPLRNGHFRVVIFGSARIKEGDPNWRLIYDLAKKIAEANMDLVTGGGPGLMEAACEGHNEGDTHKTSQAIGLQILLPKRQRDAQHLDVKKEFSRFSERLDNFMELANAVVVAPGGVGTLLELFYTWQLLQVKMIRHIPIILLGDMWPPLIDWMKIYLIQSNYVNQEELGLLVLTNNVEDAMKMLHQAQRKFLKNQNPQLRKPKK